MRLNLGPRPGPRNAPFPMDMNFATQTYKVDGTSYPSIASVHGYTFTRTETVVYRDTDAGLDSFAPNVAAINSRGYHAHGALTNFLFHSQAFDNATVWAKNSVTVTPNTALAPDGTTTMDSIVEDAINSTKFVSQSVALTTGTVYTKSFVGKPGGLGFIQIASTTDANQFANFNLNNGTIGSSGSCTPYIVPLANGTYRCIMVWTLGADATHGAAIIPVDSATAGRAAPYVGAGRAIPIWQHQVIAGNHPDGGPFIATAATAVTVGASALSFGVANGRYNATYTFDDNSSQQIATTISNGSFAHPIVGTLNRPVVKRTLLTLV